MINPKPKSDLAKLLHVLVQEVAAISPQAFVNIYVDRAIEEVDRTVTFVCDVCGKTLPMTEYAGSDSVASLCRPCRRQEE